jgi:hypothetical protein
MDFGNLLGDAFAYTREGVFGNVNRWLKLILAIICLGLPFNGYVMRIYRGVPSAPEVDNWGTLFVDGLKLLVVGIVYAIPIMVIWVLLYGSMILALFSGRPDDAAMTSFTPNLILLILMYIIEIIVASIRFARTGSFSEAFNFSAILETIGKIGWINYIIALVLVSLVIAIPICILVFAIILIAGATIFLLKLGLAALLGFILCGILLILILAPLFGVFQARCMTQVYESAAPGS